MRTGVAVSPSWRLTFAWDVAKRRARGDSAVGSRGHYADGRYYDQAYRRRRHDVRFYCDLALRCGGPVLELGAGTGRVSLAIARLGIDVVGVEPVPSMLERAKQRRDALPRSAREHLELREADLLDLRLRRRFPLVIAPFNVWNHLYSRRDFERGMRTVRHHLSSAGRFAFDVLLPDVGGLARRPDKRYRGGIVPHPRDGARYRYSEYFRYDPRTQIQTVMMDFEHPTQARKSFCTPLTQRQFFPAELEPLLHYNGFLVERHDGGFEGEPIAADSESQVVVARAVSPHSRSKTSQ